MSDYFVGQEVVCVDDDMHHEWPENRDCIMIPVGAVRGSHYKVQWVGSHTQSNGCRTAVLRLEGVKRINDYPLNVRRFRPIKTESIQIFRDMCINVKRNIDA